MMKRIPRIKFPQRHPKLSTSAESGEIVASASKSNRKLSEVAAPPTPSTNVGGGKASNQPKRTPVSDKEIEAILLGGCF